MTKYLYGREWDEHLEDDPDTVVEQYMADTDPAERQSFVLIQHTIVPTINHFPSAEDVLEHVVEWTSENGEVDEGFHDNLVRAAQDQSVLPSFQAALEVLASKVTYSMADREVGRIQVEFVPRQDDYTLDCSEARVDP